MNQFTRSLILGLGIVSLIGISPFEVPQMTGQISPLISLNSSAATPASTPYITGQTITTLRNDFTGCLGFSFTMGASDVTVTDLGRWVTSGNSASHDVVMRNAGGLVLATANVNTSGAAANAYLYASITPLTLTHGLIYQLLSQETNGGDQFADDNTTITTTAIATPAVSAFMSGGPPCVGFANSHNPSVAYVPPNFKYHL